jgi:two-component system response regulator YesN
MTQGSYSVFLVEDEVVVREGIRDSVPWAGSGFHLAGEAADGEMALPLIQDLKPDILITDIKMPFMDGLELSRIVRRNLPWVKIIILSGHDEFSFAREAISLAVTDYLLKPLSAADLLATLRRVAGQIEAETAAREKIENLNRSLATGRQLMAERFLNDLATGLVPPGEALRRAGELGLALTARCYIVASLTPRVRPGGDASSQYAEYLKAVDLIGSLLAGNPDVVRFSRSLRELILIFKGEEPAELERHCYAVCHSLKYEVERKTACALTARIGAAREGIQGIAESLAEAETAHRFAYIFGEDSVIGIEDARRVNFRGSQLLKLDPRGLAEGLRRGERADIPALLEGYLARLASEPADSFYRAFAAAELALTAARFVEELGGEADRVLPQLGRLAEEARAGELRGYLSELLAAAFDFREARKRDKYGDLLLRARAYLDANFADPEISLHAVARQVSVSPSHFSTIFSQEAGRTFIAYLTETRIRRAMELLKTTSLRSSEIAYRVGYKDPHYFSYIFKASAGCTPTEFRRRGSEP